MCERVRAGAGGGGAGGGRVSTSSGSVYYSTKCVYLVLKIYTVCSFCRALRAAFLECVYCFSNKHYFLLQLSLRTAKLLRTHIFSGTSAP